MSALAVLISTAGCAVNRGDQLGDRFASYLEEHAAVTEAWGFGANNWPFQGELWGGSAVLVPGASVGDAEDAYRWARDYDDWESVDSLFLTFEGTPLSAGVRTTVGRDMDLDHSLFVGAVALRDGGSACTTLPADARGVTLRPGTFIAAKIEVDAAVDSPGSVVATFACVAAAAQGTGISLITVESDDATLSASGGPDTDLLAAVAAYDAVVDSYPVVSASLEPTRLTLVLDMAEDSAVAGLVRRTAGPDLALGITWLDEGDA